MRRVIRPHVDGVRNFGVEGTDRRQWSQNTLSSWEMTQPHGRRMSDLTPEEQHAALVYTGPPRVLEIGCSDGRWCMSVKTEQPKWFVEGVDDKDLWNPPPGKSRYRYVIHIVTET